MGNLIYALILLLVGSFALNAVIAGAIEASTMPNGFLVGAISGLYMLAGLNFERYFRRNRSNDN